MAANPRRAAGGWDGLEALPPGHPAGKSSAEENARRGWKQTEK